MADRSALSRERAVHNRVAAANGVPVIVWTSREEQHEEWHTVLGGMIFLDPLWYAWLVTLGRMTGTHASDRRT